MLCPADTEGYLYNVIGNMVGYARASGTLGESQLTTLVEDVRTAIEARTYPLALPRFLVTGVRPGPDSEEGARGPGDR